MGRRIVQPIKAASNVIMKTTTETDQLNDLASKIRHVADCQLHPSIFVSCFSTVGLLILKLFIAGVIAYTKLDFRINKEEKEKLIRELKTLYSEC